NINTATLDTLENIKGLGPTKAQAIVDYRNKNGNFQTLQDLQKVPGIGPKLFDKIQSQVTIG
ncbi:MAG: ComEA family DNA-binding protein, partial [Gammaproteobacteria bacterium]